MNAGGKPAIESVAATRVFDAFRHYNQRFREITRRAARHFETGDRASGRLDAVRRIELYNKSVAAVIQDLKTLPGDALASRDTWRRIRAYYAELINDCADSEFYKTFFSSVTRRLFDTVGVDPEIEFLAVDVSPEAAGRYPLRTHAYPNRGSLRHLFDEMLGDLPFSRRFRDVDATIAFIVAEIDAWREEAGIETTPESVETIAPLFYRGRRAYAVGRIKGAGWQVPLVIPFANSPAGITVDAVILTENEVSKLFGFTTSYFHVDLDVVGSAVRFLLELMPKKPLEEVYTVLGRAKQGKTERYRSLMRHLDRSDDLFVPAPGAEGMVMQVFTLPSYNVVFKIIRDRFRPPKSIRPAEVKAKYELVFKHDRAGRLVDAQEFRRLSFQRSRFDAELLETLLATCSHNCRLEGDQLLVEHLYIERRLTPLNLYMQNAPRPQAEAAIIDYGQAIRDLASSNIFAGDLLLKNFGLTRHGRVIFYDYDEVSFVTDCSFRPLPQSDRIEDEMSAEPWFFVSPTDVFPEEFIRFLGLDAGLQEVFRRYHGELLRHEWWNRIKSMLAHGEPIEVLPYSATTRTTKLPGAGLYASRMH